MEGDQSPVFPHHQVEKVQAEASNTRTQASVSKTPQRSVERESRIHELLEVRKSNPYVMMASNHEHSNATPEMFEEKCFLFSILST